MRNLAMRLYLRIAFLFVLIGIPANTFAGQQCPDIPGAAYSEKIANQKLSGYIVPLQPGTQVSKINLKSTLSNLLSRKFQEKNDERFNCISFDRSIDWMCTVSSTGERYVPIKPTGEHIWPTEATAIIPDRNGKLVQINQSQSDCPGCQSGENGGITDNYISVGFVSCISQQGGYYTLARISIDTPTGWIFLPYLILYKHTKKLSVEMPRSLPAL